MFYTSTSSVDADLLLYSQSCLLAIDPHCSFSDGRNFWPPPPHVAPSQVPPFTLLAQVLPCTASRGVSYCIGSDGWQKYQHNSKVDGLDVHVPRQRGQGTNKGRVGWIPTPPWLDVEVGALGDGKNWHGR